MSKKYITKWNLGDHGVIWREKYLSDSLSHLLGQEVIVVDIKDERSSFAENWVMIMDLNGDFIVTPRKKYLTVRRYQCDDEALYRVDSRCMSKTRKKIEIGNWEECPWNPYESE